MYSLYLAFAGVCLTVLGFTLRPSYGIPCCIARDLISTFIMLLGMLLIFLSGGF